MTSKKRLSQELAGNVVPLREMRLSRRHLTLQRCLVCPVEAGEAEGWRCVVYDVSRHGLGLTLPLPVRPGTLLTVKPYDVCDRRPLTVRAVRTTPVGWLWFCGAELLAPLSEEQLQAWLEASTDWLPCDLAESLV